jgi:hypothetical protein
MECDFHGRETKHVGEIVNILPGKTLKYKDKHDHDLGFSLTFKNDVTCMLKPASIIDGLAKQITIKCSFTKQLKKIQHLALQEDA